jgi:hypothetical protein
MPEDDPNKAAEQPAPAVTSVAHSVLGQFFDQLAATEDLADIAPRLRGVVLDEAVFAEPAIRAALFSDMP